MTTTQVARREDNHGMTLAGPAVPDAVASLAEWAQQLDAAMRIAKALCNTSFVPKHFAGKPEETAAAILAGHELGLGPTAALRVFYVINGRPEMYAEAKVAILTAHGHRVWTVERTAESVTVAGRRSGEERVEEITITMEEAKQAGWTSNATYQKTPKDMLWARAASRVCKLVAPELLHGIATVGEPEEPPIHVTATVGRVTSAEILGTDAEEARPEEAPVEEPRGGITSQQSKKLYALLRQTGRENKDVALVYIAGVIGRPIESTKDLGRGEASNVIDALAAEVRDELEPPQSELEVADGD